MLNLVLITHEGIATSMIKVAEAIIGQPMKGTYSFEVPMDSDPAQVFDAVSACIDGSEVDTIVMTDLVGSTPYNIAHDIAARYRSGLVCGLNLPMLLKVYNYRAYQMEEVVGMAVEGGRAAITANDMNGEHNGDQ